MEIFENKLTNYRNLRIDKKKLSGRISVFRLLIFIVGVLICIDLFGGGHRVAGVISILAFGIGFLAIVLKHDSIIREIERLQCKIAINEKYIARRGDGWSKFEDSGDEFVDSKHQFTSDLDIFGRGSLFKWLNISNTYYGREKLKSLLKAEGLEEGEIKARQGAVQELSEKLDFCEELECLGKLAKGIEKNPEKLIAYSRDKTRLFKQSWMYNIFYALPFITIMILALYLFNYKVSVGKVIAMILLQLLITAIGSIKTNSILGTVSDFKESIEAYSNIIKLIEKEEFKSEYLVGMKSKLTINQKPASFAIKKLEKVADAVDMRHNLLAYLILNALLLWDYHSIIALEEWRLNYGECIKDWLLCIGSFEAFGSLAVMCHLQNKYTFPRINNEGLRIKATELGHPLINPSKRVNNDVDIMDNICIITGSNMSGKTTLLRTIGISLVLAYAGAPVFAEEFSCSVMEVFTSMRIEDDLNNGISTFYAELLRVKKIIEFSKNRRPMLFLIDEIFKGTNSRDRLTGAVSLINNLDKSWIIGLISTHDFELCDLENRDKARIINYHFSESYTKDEILFDYKLKEGRCTTTNAKYLMRMVGIEIDE